MQHAEEDTVTTHTMDVLDLLRKHAEEPDLDFLREALRILTQAVMDAEVAVEIGADLHERTPIILTS